MSEKNTLSGKSRAMEVLDILENFKFHASVSNKVLEAYCQRKKYEFLSAGEYQDHLYQYNHDQRAIIMTPLIIEALQGYQYVPDYIGDAKRKEIKASNEAIEYKIAKICEDAGIQYREVDVYVKNIASEMQAIIDNASNRMNNMCGLVISTLAQDKFGSDLKVADLAKFHRERAGELAVDKPTEVVVE